ncbi:MAG: glycosyltransferase family 4 protein [Azospirillaceae bacterium]
MRTLYITIEPPAPASSGHRLRVRQLHRAFASAGEVRLVVLCQRPRADDRRAMAQAGIAAEYLPPRRESGLPAVLRQARAVLAGQSRWSAKSLSARRRARLRRLVETWRPDLVVLGATALSPLIEDVRTTGARIVVDNHNVETRLARRMLAGARGKERLRFLVDYVNMTSLERRMRAADAVWACSGEDADALARICPGVRSVSVPNVVDDALLDRAVAPAGDDRTLVFVGGLSYWPNLEAAWRLIALSERLAARGVDHRVRICGRHAPRDLVEAARHAPAVEIAGWVPDIAAEIADAALLAAPLLSGSGTKFKVIEAMALARPVVTTTVGAEGLDVRPGHELAVAETNEALVDAIASLLADRPAREAMGRAAREFVRRHFSQAVLDAAIRDADGSGAGREVEAATTPPARRHAASAS